jgi:hypothetical protein
MTLREPMSAMTALLRFRDLVYARFSRRADTLFEMLDALLLLPGGAAPVHLSQVPGFQRGWGSIYDALAGGRIDQHGLEAVLAQYPLEAGKAVYALDASNVGAQ